MQLSLQNVTALYFKYPVCTLKYSKALVKTSGDTRCCKRYLLTGLASFYMLQEGRDLNSPYIRGLCIKCRRSCFITWYSLLSSVTVQPF